MGMHEEDIKPKNLSLHDFLIRKTGVKLMIDETIVEKVIAHEKKSIKDAFRIYHEVEMSGFGKFYISKIKLHKRIERQERIVSALTKKLSIGEDEGVRRNFDIAQRELTYYKARSEGYENRHKGNNRGSKKLLLSSEGVEGGDRESGTGEEGDMRELPSILS